MVRPLHRWTIGKQLDEPHLNEDALACSFARGIYAVSDGASESFASRHWARILVRRYLYRPALDAAGLAGAIQEFNRHFDRPSMSWSAQAAFDRGSFATLLALHFEGNGVRVLGIGDSLAVLDDGAGIRATFPYTSPEQFRVNPLLLSTLHDRNAAVLERDAVTRWSFEGIEAPRIYAMTDAIGAWLLSDPEPRLAALRDLRQLRDFVALVEAARLDGSMRRDDTTLLVIG
ncbi:MAG: hypothetical protein JWQ89_430 [Devosia sp.]|uniref:hypothetical protein n=1 Tax=Devosia sp. TaxID=1871048 RepID=UPI00261822A5|nr:hypothetical protein [Devosia sp.]MDB5538703.1 hypothetical protein [Devosia sp.]